MTSKDKTGDQLVASIRKSKTGAVTRKNTGRAPTSKKAPVKRARTDKAVSSPASEPQNGYSYGHRVWPD